MRNFLVVPNYIRKIRNYGKRKYAEAYYDFRRGFLSAPDFVHFRISTMAAQAVRMQIDALMGD